MRNYLSFLIFCFIFSSTSFASEPVKQVPPVMYEFLGELMRVQPYMVSEKKFVDPKNAKEIQEHLDRFANISKRLSHNKRLSTSNFQIPASVIQEHFANLSETFRAGRKSFARRMLNASMDGCSSCHTQVSGRGPEWKFREDEIKGSLFDKAEFRFTARHYDEALKNYNEYIRAPKVESSQLETALRRKLFIFVRVKRDPASGADSFRGDAALKNMPAGLKTEVQSWVIALKKISLKKEDETKLTAETLEALASKMLPPLLEGGAQFKPDSLVSFLYVSGLIFNFINSHPEADVTPGLLYWLAICDGQLNQSFFFALTDLYLKECISRFPTSPMAKKCFSELKTSTELASTGSAGTDISKEDKQMLEYFGRKIDEVAKVKP